VCCAQVDLAWLKLRGKPFSDKEEHVAECFRCGTRNPLFNENGLGDRCLNCSHPFVRSFLTFDVLPLVRAPD
jgi:intraflagellar transport protein 122